MHAAEADGDSKYGQGRLHEAVIAFGVALANCDVIAQCRRLEERIDQVRRTIAYQRLDEERRRSGRAASQVARTALNDLLAQSGSATDLRELDPHDPVPDGRASRSGDLEFIGATDEIGKTVPGIVDLRFIDPRKDLEFIGATDETGKTVPGIVDLRFIDPRKPVVIDPQVARRVPTPTETGRDALPERNRRRLLQGAALEKAQRGARAEAAFLLGFDLSAAGEYERAVTYLREATTLFPECEVCSQELAKAEHLSTNIRARLVDQMGRYWSELAERVFGKTAYDVLGEEFLSRSKADYTLDALLYGDGSWSASRRYLEDLSSARPDDREARDAFMYMQGLVDGLPPSERGD